MTMSLTPTFSCWSIAADWKQITGHVIYSWAPICAVFSNCVGNREREPRTFLKWPDGSSCMEIWVKKRIGSTCLSIATMGTGCCSWLTLQQRRSKYMIHCTVISGLLLNLSACFGTSLILLANAGSDMQENGSCSKRAIKGKYRCNWTPGTVASSSVLSQTPIAPGLMQLAQDRLFESRIFADCAGEFSKNSRGSITAQQRSSIPRRFAPTPAPDMPVHTVFVVQNGTASRRLSWEGTRQLEGN